MAQPRCARKGHCLFLALVVLAIPTVGRAQGTQGNVNSSLVGEIKSLVDIISQAMQQNTPNREINHMNQALHQLLMALEGKGGSCHHHKHHHHHHHHGQGLGMVGSKGGMNGASEVTGNQFVGSQTAKAFGKQGLFAAFSGLLSKSSNLLSPGSRLVLVQNVTVSANNGGAFANGVKQTAKATSRQQTKECAISGGNLTTKRGQSALGATLNQCTKGSHGLTQTQSGKIAKSALVSGMKQVGQACSARTAKSQSAVNSAGGRNASFTPGGSLVNIRGNNNTVNISINSGTNQSPLRNNQSANTAKIASVAPKKQAAVAGTNGLTTGAASLNHKAKVQPKSSLASGHNTQSKGQFHASAGPKTGVAASHNKKNGPATIQGSKAKSGFGAGMNLATAKKAGGKNSSTRNQGTAKGRNTSGHGNIGASSHRGNSHSPALAKASGSHKSGR